MGINKERFPSKEEFYRTIVKLKRERELKKEGEYLGYLKEQRMRRKPRRVKIGTDEIRCR